MIGGVALPARVRDEPARKAADGKPPGYVEDPEDEEAEEEMAEEEMPEGEMAMAEEEMAEEEVPEEQAQAGEVAN